jgi:selenocysteine-specific elongation factor
MRADAAVESVGIVDVPGHIDFIKNMLAGVGGIDAAMLVIAADEGVMPQTREHLAILDLLAVPAAAVALTKTDLIDDPEWLDLVTLDVAELLAGTHLAGAPIVPVSAVTGAGLDAPAHTGGAAGRAARAPRSRSPAPAHRPHLHPQRLWHRRHRHAARRRVCGRRRRGDSARPPRCPHPHAANAPPPGRNRTPRQPRLAINLTGVSTDDLRRGDVVAHPGTLAPTLLLDARFRVLADAPRPLKHNQRVDLFVGAAEIPAVARVLGAETIGEVLPGEEGWLQLRLTRPAVVAAGDRFILRQPSPSLTLGGGVVLSPAPQRRWRRFDAQTLHLLGGQEELLAMLLEQNILVRIGGDVIFRSGDLAALMSGIVEHPACERDDHPGRSARPLPDQPQIRAGRA